MSNAAASHKRIVPIVFVTILLLLACLPVARAHAEEGDTSTNLPASFDLRDVDGRCYVTPVKFQNPFRTCWGFAAMSAAETSVLGSHLADDPNAYETLDFSEKQIAYFTQTHIDDPASSQNGEGTYSTKYKMVDGKRTLTEPLVSGDFYDTGGSAFLSINTFAAGIGPTLESADESLVYRGKEGLVQSDSSGTIPQYCYSVDDDWTIEQRLRFKQDYVLKEAYFLPTPATIDDETDTYRYNPEATTAIKEQLKQIHGVSICYHADTATPGQASSTMYISDKWAHYTYKPVSATHAVAIVGWDDNYDKGNFRHEVYKLKDPKGGYKEENYLTDENGNYVVDEEATALTVPPSNGAWLCKNSWGSGEREFPHRAEGDWGIPVQHTDADGNTGPVGSGYFWLSYHDQSLESPESYIFATDIIARGGAYDRNTVHCNQYDLMPVLGMDAYENDELIKSANVFTAKSEEILLAVSHITKTPNTTVTADVYLLNDGFTTPEDGYLVTSVTQTHELPGFYISNLDDVTVDLAPGQSYSVVVTQKRDSGKYAVDYPTGLGPNTELADIANLTTYSVAVQNNESYIYSGGSWGNWADEATRDEFLKLNEESGLGEGITKKKLEQAQDRVYDNFPIKVYAFDPQEGVYVRLAGGAKRLSVCIGEQGTTAELELYGPSSEGLTIADYANSELATNEWVLESGSEGLVEVVPSADGTSAQIKGLTPGTAYVVARIWGVGRVIIPVEVHEHKWGTPTYEWASDNSTCTATRVCEYDPSHVETETVTPTPTPTPSPTRPGGSGYYAGTSHGSSYTPSPTPTQTSGSKTSSKVSRVAGDNRYATAASVSAEGLASSAWAVVATGSNFPDALAASALAGAHGAPVVLTDGSTLSSQAASELKRLGVTDVLVMGGPSAVSDAVVSSIEAMGVRVTRLSGSDRFESSVEAFKAVRAASRASDTVVVASGAGFADALSIGPWAWSTKSPVLLARSDGTLPQSAVDALRADGGIRRVIIVGGTSAVPDAIRDQLGSSYAYERLGGSDRYETSRLVAGFATREGMSWSTVGVATGTSFPDALAASALIGRRGGVLLLTDASGASAANEIGSHASSISRVYVLGGTSAVPASVVEKISAALS